MITSIIYSSNLLDGLFSNEDIEFLKSNNSKQDKIEYELEIADLKKNEITKFLNSFGSDDSSKISDDSSFKESFEIASSASSSISSSIKNLNTLFNEFNDIEKDVLELAVKKNTISSEDLNVSLSKINDKISEFKNNKNQIEKEIEESRTNIDNFFVALDNGSLSKPKKSQEAEVESTLQVYNLYDIDFKDNLELKVSEKDKKVYLPYTKQDLQEFMNDYPNEYPSAKSVIDHEFTEKISIYNNHPVLARFREGYYLSKYKEMNSTLTALKFARSIMFRRDLNPTIIAAVRSREQLADYLECLNNNRLEDFKHFKITFEVNPL